MKAVPQEELTVEQTATGYWVVQRAGVEISGAVTRKGAEAERDLVKRLRSRTAELQSRARRRPPAGNRLPAR